MTICNGCKQEIGPKQTVHISSVYQADAELCEICFENEEEMIDQEGTNYLPELLNKYES